MIGLAGFAFDDNPGTVLTNVVINRPGIYGLSLGRNLNQGPVRAQSVWWGGIRVYREDPGWGW